MEQQKKYNVIYADPPWSYKNGYTGGGYRRKDKSIQTGRARDKYETMSIHDIKQMPIKEISDKNSVLFLWATVPLLPEALEVMKHWGFEYKTMLSWRKIMSLGMGYWFRGATEHILIGVKGNVKAFKNPSKNIYASNVGKHSVKPHYFRELISKAVEVSFEQPKKLELFARSREGFFPDYEYEGWDVYGNEVNGSIELPNPNRSVATGSDTNSGAGNQTS